MSETMRQSLRRLAHAFGKLARDAGASRAKADRLQRAYWRLLVHLEAGFNADQRTDLQALLRLVRQGAAAKSVFKPALALFAPAALVDWVSTNRPGLPFVLDDAKRWLVIARAPPGAPYVEAVVLNVASRLTTASQTQQFADLFDQLWQKEKAMAVKFIYDRRGLPPTFNYGTNPPANDPATNLPDPATSPFFQAVTQLLDSSFYGAPNASTSAANINLTAAIIGTLLQKEIFDPASVAFGPAVNDAWSVSLRDTPVVVGTKKNRNLYDEVVKVIPALPGRTNQKGDSYIAFQELASVTSFCADNANTVPMDSAYFPNQVRIGLDKYVEGTPSQLTLTIPPLTGAGGTDSGFNPEGTRAVGAISQAYQLDAKANVIRVVDRITELYMQGLLPMNYDNAAKAIEEYYWDSEDRLNEGARNSVYGRVLGTPNTEVSKEVVPNRDRDGLLQRFVAALAEHDRQQTISDLLQPGAARSMSLTVEQVRKAGRDVLANASLYGWGGTQSLARRMVQHLATAMEILKKPQVQAVFGVTSPYQVIERVSRTEFGSVPNLLMAINVGEAEKGIHDLLAKYLPAFLEGNSGQPLFDIQGAGFGVGFAAGGIQGSIPTVDERQLKTYAQAWLAARSYGDAQVEKFSQPQDSPYTGSMPTFGGAGGGAGSGDVMDKLRQMVSSGSAPSLDQLQQLLPAMR
ncbi:MAG: hypothetical protein IPJ08_20715 [Burkholderiales bacterium]|nr:hypothetical protein [Burkholderiales bacterium]